jgi:hypothetical protein
MNVASYGTTTDEDVERFRKFLEKKDRERTPDRAKKALIKSGVLDASGNPRWPTESSSNGQPRKRTKQRK